MNFNLTSRIITNIFFDDFENSLKRIFSVDTVAFSPISYSTKKDLVIHHFLSVKTNKQRFAIAIHCDQLSEKNRDQLNDYLSESCGHIKQVLAILFQSMVTANFIYKSNRVDVTHAKKITLGLHSAVNELYLTLYIPNSFFSLFSGSITNGTKVGTIESIIVQFFKNPTWTIPHISSLIQSLSNIELNRLLNQLLQQNLLSTYQLYLLTIAYPDLSLKLKQSLSKNRAQDIVNFKKDNHDLQITDRDLASGLYSIQEALFFLIINEKTVSYSRFLNNMRQLVKNIINIEQLLSKDFEEWTREMIRNKILYKTLTNTKDQVIADAIAYKPDKFITIFTKYISEQSIKDIVQLIDKKSYSSMAAAQIAIIQNYRKNRFEKLNPSPESLGYLLVSFTKKEHYNHLLLSVGWFTLSTALKEINPANTERLLESIPEAARYLIEDVLKGVLNPNIIHDEQQVQKAKKECVKMIITLCEKGYIDIAD